MPATELRDGEPIVLIDARGRRYLKTLHAGHRITVRNSVVRADDAIGQPEGLTLGTGEDEQFVVFRPSFAELVTLMPREAEPIFAKDAGLILTRGDLRPGRTAIEVGVGNGAMTLALLRAVGPSGSLHSYEIRADFAATTRQNIKLHHGDAPNWKLTVGDARLGLEEIGADHLFADIPDPATLAGPAADCLRPGGNFIFYVPTVNQVCRAHEAINKDRRFAFPETFEVLERRWHVEEQSVRPDLRMVAHTGFVSIVRRRVAC
jgi:tRNA (adenine57-N1/adenine58-N1)-methyltransferase